MKNALERMDAEKAQRKFIAVLAGNGKVDALYQRFGFSPMRTIVYPVRNLRCPLVTTFRGLPVGIYPHLCRYPESAHLGY